MIDQSPSTGHLFPPAAADLSSRLLDWYARNQRDLPWRREPTPYRVWISEIMLQQTQASRVVPYFDHWMRVFPHVRAVADADQSGLLKVWEGLGYYTRAKNIQAAARIICAKHNEQLPSSLSALLSLPGIGPYTASAIASFAFHRNVPVVDANVQRVMARILNISQPIKFSPAQKAVHSAMKDLIPQGQSPSLNQAVMELGALVCLPRSPACSSCPITGFCRSLAADKVHARPVLPSKRKSTAIEVAAGVLVDQERILIQKRPPQGLMANLWEFPGGKLQPGESPEQALIREFREELELDIRVEDKITLIKHSYTRFRVTLHVFWCTLARPGQEPVLHAATEARWTSASSLSSYPFPSADRRLIQMLQNEGGPYAGRSN
ncbi:A/G-specific adenine glycosylase [Desulfovermiculus halophilus]|uniref:A/G-specific adenine glycosylase n=1 Tax=Desulfovermiculus halophilus TaxID=339722 RepID=UPI00068901E5|nr:A/G-specific adenine glycosylase [Desulfovermiculus halophilus]